MREEHRRRVLGERSTNQGGGKRRGVIAKKVLKANARRRILSWSNWELLLGFSQVFTSSPTAPMMPGHTWCTWHCLGRRGKAVGFDEWTGGFAVCGGRCLHRTPHV